MIVTRMPAYKQCHVSLFIEDCPIYFGSTNLYYSFSDPIPWIVLSIEHSFPPNALTNVVNPKIRTKE
jgi:hypothetical protein